MRIIAGEFRGRRLAALGKGDTRAHLRPTTDRVRESLFSVLTHLDAIRGARVLDLFAGTGALGFEALSRGAEHATFVDDARVAGGLIRRNMALLQCGARSRLINRDVTRLGRCPGERCDLVFLDPPYGQGLGATALAAIHAGAWLARGALVVCEENAPTEVPAGFCLEDRRRYGETHVTLLRHR